MEIYNHNVTIVSYKKNDIYYAGVYAWACQVGYEETICLIGSQSVTGKNISVGDIVGVSVASKSMKDEVMYLGSTHSDEVEKLKNVKFDEEGKAITFPNAKVTMLCEVKDILHVKGIEEDSLVLFKVLKQNESETEEFLHMSDLKEEMQ